MGQAEGSRTFWMVFGCGVLTAAFASGLLGAGRPGIVRGGGGDRAGTPRRGWSHSPGVVIRMRDVPVPRPQVPAPAGIVRQAPRPPQPTLGADGAAFRTRALAGPPRQPGIVRNPDFGRQLSSQRGLERDPGRFYWHRHGGVPYVHRFYHDVDWYGFWHGGAFFWMRPFGGFWWWYDPFFARWVYWYDNYWWWPGPGGALYVYMDNNYYPYDSVQGIVTVKSPQVETPPPAAPPPPETSAGAYASPDKTRLVRI
ncbi:MAG: hypothetical protein PHF00_12165, partial [Elusimicrobia bacterium]|nr:hypothetical protein [Elusimicrobiota bacterium]